MRIAQSLNPGYQKISQAFAQNGQKLHKKLKGAALAAEKPTTVEMLLRDGDLKEGDLLDLWGVNMQGKPSIRAEARPVDLTVTR